MRRKLKTKCLSNLESLQNQLDKQWVDYGQLCYKIEDTRNAIIKHLPMDSRKLVFNLDYLISQKILCLQLMETLEAKIKEEQSNTDGDTKE